MWSRASRGENSSTRAKTCTWRKGRCPFRFCSFILLYIYIWDGLANANIKTLTWRTSKVRPTRPGYTQRQWRQRCSTRRCCSVSGLRRDSCSCSVPTGPRQTSRREYIGTTTWPSNLTFQWGCTVRLQYTVRQYRPE